MVKYSVCTFAIKLSFFFLDVTGLVVIAKKPVMPKDVSVSFVLSFSFTGQEYSVCKCFTVFSQKFTAFAVEFLLFSLVALNQQH